MSSDDKLDSQQRRYQYFSCVLNVFNFAFLARALIRYLPFLRDDLFGFRLVVLTMTLWSLSVLCGHITILVLDRYAPRKLSVERLLAFHVFVFVHWISYSWMALAFSVSPPREPSSSAAQASSLTGHI